MSYGLVYTPYNTNLFLNSSGGGSAFDPDAQAFITAATITNPTQQTAINSLVLGLKSNGLWTKMNAVYPFVGGTASTHKWNLKDPRDLDAAYRLVFGGGWTHSSTGATPNGVNAYADTYLVPSIVLNYASLSYYSRTSTAEIGTGDTNGIVVGVRSDNTTVNNALNLRVKSNPTNNNDFFYSRTGSNSNNSVRVIDSSGAGFFSGALDATSSKLYKNGINLTGTLNSFPRNAPNLSIYIGALNNKGTAGEYSLKESAFAHIGDTLNATEMANLYTVVQAFQTTLGRQI